MKVEYLLGIRYMYFVLVGYLIIVVGKWYSVLGVKSGTTQSVYAFRKCF